MKVDPVTAAFIWLVSLTHVATYRLFGGAGPLNRNTLILTTRGRKTGREHSKPLLYYRDGKRLYVVASYGGSDSAPQWYLNLSKNPEVKAEVGRETRTYRARTLPEEEAKKVWPGLLAIYPTYSEYKKKTQRTIPIVELAPV